MPVSSMVNTIGEAGAGIRLRQAFAGQEPLFAQQR
jgi:hypothetical protein